MDLQRERGRKADSRRKVLGARNMASLRTQDYPRSNGLRNMKVHGWAVVCRAFQRNLALKEKAVRFRQDSGLF